MSQMVEVYTAERKFTGFPESINSLRFGPQGNTLAIGGDDGAVTLVDFLLGTIESRWVANAPVTALHWQSPSIIIAGYGDGGIARLNTAQIGDMRVCYSPLNHAVSHRGLSPTYSGHIRLGLKASLKTSITTNALVV